MSNVTVGTVTKETPLTSIGITFERLEDGKIRIEGIQSCGLVAATDLKVGMEVVSVNNVHCRGRPLETILVLIDDSVGAICIVGREDIPLVLVPYPVTIPHTTQASPLNPGTVSNLAQEEALPQIYDSRKQTKVKTPFDEQEQTKLVEPATEDVPSPRRSPPPGIPDGGTWGNIIFVGKATFVMCALGCVLFAIPGIFVLFCPQDKKEAYLVDNKVYDPDGKLLGSAHQVNFIADES